MDMGYVLAPQCRIANCDECIASNLLGRDLYSKSGQQKRCLMVLTPRVS